MLLRLYRLSLTIFTQSSLSPPVTNSQVRSQPGSRLLHLQHLPLHHQSLAASLLVQVIDEFLPGASDHPHIPITELNLTSIFWHPCVSDHIIYHPAVTYSTTDFYFVEFALDSTLMPGDKGYLSWVQNERDFMLNLLTLRGYQQNLEPLPAHGSQPLSESPQQEQAH